MSLLDEILAVEENARREVLGAREAGELEPLRTKYLGRKGELARTLTGLKSLEPWERPRTGAEANRVKQELERLFEEKARELARSAGAGSGGAGPDLTMPATARGIGVLHPITQVTDEICDIFSRLGFGIASGPEMETEYHNFEALNIPPNHPSRDGFDTFYLDNGKLLRSQTSTVQIRVMEKTRPPIKVIAPGKVYRPDATDASHSFMFHQIEGLVVQKGVSFAHLKGMLAAFAKAFFGAGVRTRFRPHFFPFTEPSAEVDVSCAMCGGSGCRVCSGKGWLEILGAGMVHPRVLEMAKINPETFGGFAFGMGVERIAMLRWGVDDIRLFYENDARFLREFQ